jgi:hypothetical protein
MTVSEWHIFLSNHGYTVKRDIKGEWDKAMIRLIFENIRIEIELLDHNGIKYHRWIHLYKRSKMKDRDGNHFWTQTGFPVFPFFRVSDYIIVILTKVFFWMKFTKFSI